MRNALREIGQADGFELSTSWSRTREFEILKPCLCRTSVPKVLQNPSSVVPLVPHHLIVASESLSVSSPERVRDIDRIQFFTIIRCAHFSPTRPGGRLRSLNGVHEAFLAVNYAQGTVSCVSKCNNWVHFRGAPSRDVTSKQCDADKKHRDRQKRQRIGGPHAVEQS